MEKAETPAEFAFQIKAATSRINEKLRSLDEFADPSIYNTSQNQLDSIQSSFDTLTTSEHEQLLNDIVKWAKKKNDNYESFDSDYLDRVESFQKFYTDSLIDNIDGMDYEINHFDGHLESMKDKIDYFHKQMDDFFHIMPTDGLAGSPYLQVPSVERSTRSSDNVRDQTALKDHQIKFFSDAVKKLQDLLAAANKEIREYKVSDATLKMKLNNLLKDFQNLQKYADGKEEILNKIKECEEAKMAGWRLQFHDTLDIKIGGDLPPPPQQTQADSNSANNNQGDTTLYDSEDVNEGDGSSNNTRKQSKIKNRNLDNDQDDENDEDDAGRTRKSSLSSEEKPIHVLSFSHQSLFSFQASDPQNSNLSSNINEKADINNENVQDSNRNDVNNENSQDTSNLDENIQYNQSNDTNNETTQRNNANNEDSSSNKQETNIDKAEFDRLNEQIKALQKENAQLSKQLEESVSSEKQSVTATNKVDDESGEKHPNEKKTIKKKKGKKQTDNQSEKEVKNNEEVDNPTETKKKKNMESTKKAKKTTKEDQNELREEIRKEIVDEIEKKYKDEFEALKAQISSLMEENQNLKNDMESSKAEKEEIKKQLEDLNAASDQLRADLENAKNENISLQQQHEQDQMNLQDKNNQIQILNQESDSIKSQLNDKINQNQNQNEQNEKQNQQDAINEPKLDSMEVNEGLSQNENTQASSIRQYHPSLGVGSLLSFDTMMAHGSVQTQTDLSSSDIFAKTTYENAEPPGYSYHSVHTQDNPSPIGLDNSISFERMPNSVHIDIGHGDNSRNRSRSNSQSSGAGAQYFSNDDNFLAVRKPVFDMDSMDKNQNPFSSSGEGFENPNSSSQLPPFRVQVQYTPTQKVFNKIWNPKPPSETANMVVSPRRVLKRPNLSSSARGRMSGMMRKPSLLGSVPYSEISRDFRPQYPLLVVKSLCNPPLGGYQIQGDEVRAFQKSPRRFPSKDNS